MNKKMPHNIDPEEIAKFDAMAHDWWDPNGDMKPLHQLNPLRFEYIEKQVALEGKQVLDIGCGGGILSEALANANAHVTGIDASEAALNIAKSHAKKNQLTIHYHHSTAEEYAKKSPEKFDVVTCMELLEHVPHPSTVIKACADLIKPGGFLFFSTINRNLKSFLYAIVGAEYILRLLPKGTHQYEKFIRPSELTTWASDNDLQLGGIQGIRYHALEGCFSFTNTVDVNYLIYFKK